MWDSFAPRLRRAVFAALRETGDYGRAEATAGDLLTVILRDAESAAAYIVERAGLSAEKVLREARPAVRPGPRPDGPGKFGKAPARAQRLTSAALHVLDVAVAESRKLGDAHVGTEHVLLAFTLARHVEESEALSRLGLTHERVLEGRSAWKRDGMPRRRPKGPRVLAAAAAPLKGLASRLVPRAVRESLGGRMSKAARLPALAWNAYVRHSLAHPRFVTDPYPLYRSLRLLDPVRRDPLFPAWVVTRHADVMTVLRDPRFRRDPFAGEEMPGPLREQLEVPDAASVDAPGGLLGRQMLFLDPPRHTRVRAVFAKAFAGRAVQGLRPRIQRIAYKRLDRVQKAGSMDLIHDLAYPLPTIVIAELLGFPPEDYKKIKKWSDDLAATLALNPSGSDQATAAQSVEELRDYFGHVVATLRRRSGAGRNDEDATRPASLLSELLAADARGEGLGPEDLFANCVLLLAAGHETTTNLIGNGVLALLRHRDQWDALRADPDLMPSAVEELLRYDSPVQWTSRVTAEDVSLGGRQIERGQFVLACLGAANRDPTVFPDPDRLDVRRRDNKHLAFGQGIHFCLGATLARLEAEVAIGTLVARFPNLRLGVPSRKLKWHKGLTFRGVRSLPLAW